MNFTQRKAVHTELRQYCHMAKPHEIVEVTEWTNGEGWDIALNEKTFQLTMGELQAITVLCNVQHPKG
jgi:hypothetical protein